MTLTEWRESEQVLKRLDIGLYRRLETQVQRAQEAKRETWERITRKAGVKC